MLVQTYAALYRATGDEKYARYGGLAASWYFGNNMAGAQMYFPDSGHVYDGINGPVSWRVNRNSGAESTIEGLMSLIAIADIPQAVDLLHVEAGRAAISIKSCEAENGAARDRHADLLHAATGRAKGYISAGRYVGWAKGSGCACCSTSTQEDDYLLYVDHLHQAASSSSNAIQRARHAADHRRRLTRIGRE